MFNPNEKQEKKSSGSPNTPVSSEKKTSIQHSGETGAKSDSSSGGKQPLVSLPKGGGAIRGMGEKFDVNPVTGTGSFTVPIAISPGRGGFTPQLALSYDSGGGNTPFGLGWNVGFPEITRKTDKGLPRYFEVIPPTGGTEGGEEEDVFILSGAEDLVHVLKEVNNQLVWDSRTEGIYTIYPYRPRTEGLFALIERWYDTTNGKSHWRSISKENITSIYGYSESARIAAPDDDRKIFSWLVEKSWDAKGNLIEFEYKPEDNTNVPSEVYDRNRLASADCFANRYLKQVRYGNAAMYAPAYPAIPDYTDDWRFFLVFDCGDHDQDNPALVSSQGWACRQDPFSSYKSGFDIRTYRLCRRILMFHNFAELNENNPVLVRSTDLEYEENKFLTTLKSVQHTSYRFIENQTLPEVASLPKLEFSYSQAAMSSTLYNVDPSMMQNIPSGVDGNNFQWSDLYSEGISGILHQDDHAWYFIPNNGDKHYYDTPVAGTDPSPDLWLGKTGVELKKPAALKNKRASYHLGDVDSDGLPELVIDAPGMKGYYTRDEAGEWQPFKTFPKYPNISMGDPLVKMIDLTGNGLADILIGKGDYFEIYLSEGIKGYNNFRRIVCKTNEEQGPKAVFSDELRRIYLADMSGDGLTDIVRITNGSVCYWPNLGYGLFGQKVEMKNAPFFDSRDQFNPSQLRLIDVDGTGSTDIIYFGSRGSRYWLNQAGNGWSSSNDIPFFPIADKSSTVEAVDLLGNGTSCLVWSSSLPGKNFRIRYLELTGGIKPYLLTQINNNMGGITRLQYAPSTKFYLRDKLNGKPWITRLPFPVHCLERVEIRDEVAGNIFVNIYAYHHGHYDHAEREFRGFGMVEQWDTETFSAMQSAGYNAEGANIDEHSHVPPVYTKTWFHTGFYKNSNEISSHYAQEYFSADTDAWLLTDTILPQSLSAIESREACRALRGSALRKEVYAQDNSPVANIPYTVEEKSYNIRFLQPVSINKHAVFHVSEAETIAYQYERNAADPRILHSLVLQTDEFGNILKSAQVAYPRRGSGNEPEQETLLVTYAENNFAKITDTPGVWLLGVNYKSLSYEVNGISPGNSKFDVVSLLSDIVGGDEIDYATPPPYTGVKLRNIQHDKVLFWNQGITAPLALGEVAPHALVYQKQSLEITSVLAANSDLSELGSTIAQNDGAYLVDNNDNYWIVSEIQTYNVSRFYLSVTITDSFTNNTNIDYDNYDLLMTKITDALNFETNVVNDYRVLQPCTIADPNGSSQSVEFDTLGLVCKLALDGANNEGDTLTDPTIAYAYDLNNWKNNSLPNFVRVFMREKHGTANAVSWDDFDLNTPGENEGWIESITYTGGLGNELLTKTQAEDGFALDLSNNILALTTVESIRWIVNGRVILNNKGKTSWQCEPYFTLTNEWDNFHLVSNASDFIQKTEFSYDPLIRVIRIDYPDGTFSKTEFTAWEQKLYDQNDTAKDSQWYIDSGNPEPAGSEPTGYHQHAARAAWLSAQHYDTPQTQYFDNLGRVFIIEDDNGLDNLNQPLKYRVRNALDITGRITEVTDAKGRPMTQNIYGLKQQLYVNNIDSGERWMLADVAGKPIFAFNSRGFTYRNTYDQLQRPLEMWVTPPNASEILVEKNIYGTNNNHYNIGRAEYIYDQSGVTHFTEYDFKGNPAETVKQFCEVYDSEIDWNQNPAPALKTESFTQQSEYDALNRPVFLTQPDNSNIRYTYNKAALLEKAELKHLGTGNFEEYVSNIDYNEKGQRTDIYFANGSKTHYDYDAKNFRLTKLITTRNTGQDILQYLKYVYDAVGNIVEIYDPHHNIHDAFYFNYSVVTPRQKFWYDPLYRLVKATGRELAGLGMPGYVDFANDIPVPNIDQNAMQSYTHNYSYDEIGNIQHLQSIGNWSRDYYYNTNNNYLLNHDNQTNIYTYDEHGNITSMPHLSSMVWDFKDRLIATTQGTETTFYRYNIKGERTRKITEKQNGIYVERLYLGGYEVYREHASNLNVDFERQSISVCDIKLPEKNNSEQQQAQEQQQYSVDYNKKIIIIEIKTIEDGDPVSPLEITKRYQYSNHLGTACLELDENAAIISFEEYHPFGTTSYRSGSTEAEVSFKRYKYVGKERDQESGLYYYGARYYAHWLCRFVSVDPLQFKYPELTPFQYASNRPVNGIDLDGLEWKDKSGNLLTSDQRENVKVYIFYDPRASGDHGGFSEQTMKQYDLFEKQYGSGSVALSASTTESQFKTDWGTMEGSPAIVAINMHGSNQAIHIQNDVGEYITSTEIGVTNVSGTSATNVSDLPTPKADISNAELQLNTCKSNSPWQHTLLGPNKLTLAEDFLKQFNFKQIRTSGWFGVSYNSNGTARPEYYMPWNYLYKNPPKIAPDPMILKGMHSIQ